MTAAEIPHRPSLLATALELIRADAAGNRFAAWGTSTLIDEFTRVPSIDRSLFDALHRAAGIVAEYPVGNAGVLHVYGYWFSDVPTPFGLKRERWSDGALALAFGLSPETFQLRAQSGTTPLQRIAAAMHTALESPPEGALTADALIPAPTPGGHLRRSRVVLRRARRELPWALSYGIAAPGADPRTPLQLITTFPVSGDPAPLLADFVAHPALRWNAVSNS